MKFAQNDDQGAETMFGMPRNSAMTQEAGTVQTPVSALSPPGAPFNAT